tara:strand:- start:3821 stop:3976 length:156 start_codon:yes stop_codon:yes gene_type:complete
MAKKTVYEKAYKMAMKKPVNKRVPMLSYTLLTDRKPTWFNMTFRKFKFKKR